MDTKLKAHIGDALASLFARLLINEAIGLKNNHYQSRHFVHSNRLVSNEHFTKTCIRFNLFEAKECDVWSYRKYGTLYEAYLYDLYLSGGIDNAYNFFKKTAYKLYTELYEEMPVL